MDVMMVADYRCVTGEGPAWHEGEQRLYWTDIPTGRMFRYDPVTGDHEQFYAGDVVGGFTVQADGSLLLFMERGRVAIWRDGSFTDVIASLPDELESRFNDVQADPLGGVFCGTMSSPTHPGRLYRLAPDAGIAVIEEGLGTPNGMGFSLDRRTFYQTDTRPGTIYRYDYDPDTGAVSNRSVLVEAPAGTGRPDGMTVDAEGCIWSARWDGGAVFRYTPDGREMERVALPAQRVTSVAFGGRDLRDLFVTTAGGDDPDRYGSGAGALFSFRPAVPGVPEFASRVLV